MCSVYAYRSVSQLFALWSNKQNYERTNVLQNQWHVDRKSCIQKCNSVRATSIMQYTASSRWQKQLKYVPHDIRLCIGKYKTHA